jgi:hypothetical protein
MRRVQVDRPVLFLDVDGVLNPYGRDCPAGFAEHDLFPTEEPVRVNREHGLWITELLGAFDVVWASFWNEDANSILAPLLGIDPLPMLAMPSAPGPPGVKVPLVASRAGERPVTWIDDAHAPEALTWSRERAAPTLLITTDPAIGLVRAHVGGGWS